MVVQLMVMRFLGAGIAAALCVVFSVLLTTTVSAAGESYSWTDYSTIGGKGGAYTEAIGQSEGGTSALEFTQDADNPAVFTAEPHTEDCEGKLTITLSGTSNNQGTLTSSGSCALFDKLGHTFTVGASGTVNSKVANDSSQMKASFRGNSCSEVLDDAALLAECDTQVNEAYERHVATCKSQFDYTKQTYLANKYLDCLAEVLGVERPSNEKPPEEDSEQNATCAIPDVGWLMCQAMEFVGWITDKAFDVLSNMLEVEPLKEQVAGEDSKLYAAWKVFAAFANIVFVFAFIFMILAYTTNWGIGTYGLKKLAPRMIIAALLVNFSFFLCAIAVDLSNILGGTLKNTLVEMTPPASGAPNYENWSQVTKAVVAISPNDETFTKDNQPGADRDAEAEAEEEEEEPPAGGQTEEEAGDEKDLWPEPTSVLLGGLAIVGGAVLWANLSVLVPFMATTLIAIITVLIVLIIRQAVIICLIAVSPIAMAMYVLPNTKQWLDRWFDIFSKFLLIYPAVALVFGASYFASRVVLDQTSENGQTFLTMFALGIQVIPLFITPVIMKFGAGVLDRFAGVVNNPNKGPLSAIKRKAGEFREDRKNQQIGRAAANGQGAFVPDPDKSKWANRRARAGRAAKSIAKNPNAARLRQGMLRDAADSGVESALARAKKEAFNTSDAINSAANGINQGAFRDALIEESLADAAKELHDIEVSRIHAAAARFSQDKDITDDALQQMALTGKQGDKALTDIERAAATQMAANTASSEQAHELLAQSGKMNEGLRRILVDSLRKSGFTKQNSHFGGSAMNSVLEGKINSHEDIDKLFLKAAESGKYSAAGVAGQSSYALDKINKAIDEGKVSQAAANRIIDNAHTALNTPSLNAGINSNSRSGVERLAR